MMKRMMERELACLACLVFSVFTLAGCSNGNDTFTQKSYTSANHVDGITLDVRDRRIQVVPSEDQRVHIEYDESSKEQYRITMSTKHVLTMKSVENKSWTDYIGGKPSEENHTIVMHVPQTLSGNLSLSTTNENISLPALSVAGNITISCNNGDITFKPVRVGKNLSLTVKEGNISGKVVGSLDDFAIHTHVKKGKSNLPTQKQGSNQTKKTLNVSSNNGDVNIGFVKE